MDINSEEYKAFMKEFLVYADTQDKREVCAGKGWMAYRIDHPTEKDKEYNACLITNGGTVETIYVSVEDKQKQPKIDEMNKKVMFVNICLILTIAIATMQLLTSIAKI